MFENEVSKKLMEKRHKIFVITSPFYQLSIKKINLLFKNEDLCDVGHIFT